MQTPSSRVSREIRSGRMNRRPPSFVVTLVALAIVFALAWTFFLRSGPSVSAPVVNGIQGTYSWQHGPKNDLYGENGDFSAVAAGNAGGRMKSHTLPVRYNSLINELNTAYDAGTRTETTTSQQIGGPVLHTVGAWPPVWRVATHSPLDYQGLAAIVRTAVEDGDDAVGIKPLKEGDRAVWRAALTMDGKQIDLVVDQKTGIVTWYSDGKDTFTADVDWASPPPADTTYSVKVPVATAVTTVKNDAYAYAVSQAAAGRTAGYDPLISDLAPDGYTLKAVATVSGAYRPLLWLGGAASTVPIAPDIREKAVADLYARGLSWFTMEQAGPQQTRSAAASFGSLLQPPTGARLSYQQTTLQYGAFKGATAFTWYQASGPSLFVAGQRRAVFVTGALTRQELIAFAEGLKPVPADASK